MEADGVFVLLFYINQAVLLHLIRQPESVIDGRAHLSPKASLIVSLLPEDSKITNIREPACNYHHHRALR